MNKKWWWPVALSLVLIFSAVQPGFSASGHAPHVRFQDEEPGPAASNSVTITLSDLGFSSPLELRGPYQSVSAQFSFPSAWVLRQSVMLNLKVNTAFQSLMEAFTTDDPGENIADESATLRVALNGFPVGEKRIAENGASVFQVAIASDRFVRRGQDNTLTLSWEAGPACQQGINAAVTIEGTSELILSVDRATVAPLLQDFPAPFYAPHAIDPAPVALLLPADPDQETVSALAAVAAGLGKQTSGSITFSIFTADDVPESVLESHHLILIGKQADLDGILETDRDTFAVGSNGDDVDAAPGTLTVLPSTWNGDRAMLIVSGQDREALRKSSAALASSVFFTSANGSQAIIANISDFTAGRQWLVDQPLSLLFQEDEIAVQSLGTRAMNFRFNVPADISLSPEAYLELYFRHSQLINYLQSSISVALNGKTIGTIRFGDQTAANGLARIILPPNSILPLRNDLTLTFTLVPQDLCADERSGNYWVSVFGDSYLHLPPVLDGAPLTQRVSLNALRETFLRDASLSDLTFLVNENDRDALRSVAEIAGQLGALTMADLMLPNAEFLNADTIAKSKSALIIIADSTHVSASEVFNHLLPLPFGANGALKKVVTNGISFALPERQEFGILELIARGNGQKPIMLVSGNAPAGIALAVASLKERLVAPSGENANVVVIDGSENVHSFLIPILSPDKPTDLEQAQRNWMDVFREGQSNRLAVYLLIPAVLITMGYIAWLLRRSGKKE